MRTEFKSLKLFVLDRGGSRAGYSVLVERLKLCGEGPRIQPSVALGMGVIGLAMARAIPGQQKVCKMLRLRDHSDAANRDREHTVQRLDSVPGTNLAELERLRVEGDEFAILACEAKGLKPLGGSFDAPSEAGRRSPH